MNVLVIPSEEFQPPESHLAGIFQRHQCTAMHVAGWSVGVLSIRLQFSTIMILKAALLRICGQRLGRGLEKYTVFGLMRLLKDLWLYPRKFITSEEIDGYPVLRIKSIYQRRPSAANDHISWIRAGRIGFAEFCQRFGTPDLIHAHNCNPAGLLAQAIHHDTGIPYLITEHSSYYHRQLIPKSLLPGLASAFAAAEVIAVVSPALGEDLVQDVGPETSDARWIPNVIDPELEVADQPIFLSSSPFVFLSIGELIPLKGHRELIEAFAKAFPDRADVKLRIAGNGALHEELLALIHSLQMGTQISLLGRLTREEVRQAITSSHCLVLPSHYETFGVVLIEALALGRPVVASRCGGPNCIVNDENGILVPPGDVSALAIAISTMQSNYQKYDGDLIRRDVLARFGRARLLRDLSVAYRDCLQSGKKEGRNHAS